MADVCGSWGGRWSCNPRPDPIRIPIGSEHTKLSETELEFRAEKASAAASLGEGSVRVRGMQADLAALESKEMASKEAARAIRRQVRLSTRDDEADVTDEADVADCSGMAVDADQEGEEGGVRSAEDAGELERKRVELKAMERVFHERQERRIPVPTPIRAHPDPDPRSPSQLDPDPRPSRSCAHPNPIPIRSHPDPHPLPSQSDHN